MLLPIYRKLLHFQLSVMTLQVFQMHFNLRILQSGFWCSSNGWNFIIPWDHYFCNVTVYYEYFSYSTFLNERSPEAIKSCLGNSSKLLIRMYIPCMNISAGLECPFHSDHLYPDQLD